MANPYDVERTWPDYFTEHRTLTVDKQGTYRCGDLPVWTIYCPGGLLGNSTVIEGEDGLIVYDTGVNMDAGRIIADEIRKISAKPIVAIFYSHHHTDHYNGAAALVDQADVDAGKVAVYAWENFGPEKANEFGELLPRQAMGASYYGGAFLDPADKHHHGIGRLPAGGAAGHIPPTHLLAQNTTLTIAGVELDVFYTGGEAISEFGIRVPAYDMVLIADEFFTGLANAHTIRGSKPRLPDNYIKALDRVLDLRPEWLVGSHIIPIQGKEKIADSVTKYRDALQYLWDQSVRLINQGYTPVELQHKLKELPDEVVDPPYTVPVYGTPFTMVPEFFTGWVSWFSGDSTDLLPAPPAESAARLTELMGGVDAVLDAAKADHAAGRHQIAAELARIALRADPQNEDARLVKAAALRARGYQEVNPIARSWYLTGALELEGAVDPGQILGAMMPMFAAGRTVPETLRSWRYTVDADRSIGVDVRVGVHATDTGDDLTLHLRHRVLVVSDGIADDVTDVVEVGPEQVTGDAPAQLRAGSADGWDTLRGLLDTDIHPFHMHMR